MGRADARVSALEGAGKPVGTRAKHYNAWVLSCATYPAHSTQPDEGTARVWRQFRSRLFPTGNWAPAGLVVGLTVAAGARGGPRDFGSVSLAVQMISWRKGSAFTPPCIHGGSEAQWRSLLAWASAAEPARVAMPWTAAARREDPPAPLAWAAPSRVAVGVLVSHDLSTPWVELAASQRKRIGAALHTCLWHRAHGDSFTAVLRARSLARRWLPTDGEEWWLLPASRSFLVAFPVMRLLLGGVRGAAQMRTTDTRRAFPRACFRCGGSDVLWAWSTPCEGAAHAEASCGRCVGGASRMGGWPFLHQVAGFSWDFEDWAPTSGRAVTRSLDMPSSLTRSMSHAPVAAWGSGAASISWFGAPPSPLPGSSLHLRCGR